jgi:hypothetical protein
MPCNSIGDRRGSESKTMCLANINRGTNRCELDAIELAATCPLH